MTTAPAADRECVVQIPTEFYNEVMQAFIQTWDEQMRKQLEWTDAEEAAFNDDGHSKHYTGRRWSAILMKGRPAHPQMALFNATGELNEECVRQWQEMYSFEFPWSVVFEEIPEDSPLRTATDWQFLTAAQVVQAMSADIAADIAQAVSYTHLTLPTKRIV